MISFIKKLIQLFKNIFNQRTNKLSSSSPKHKKIFKLALLLIAIIGLTLLISNILKNGSNDSTVNSIDQRQEATYAKSIQTINKTYTFPLKDDKSVEVSKFKYVIDNVALQDEIIVKGQRATAVKGRTFLIVNLKIVNDSSLVFDINTRDYIRLSIEGESERFAADIHNDPVQIQAIATKPTRLGFPINDNNRKFVLYVGEIKGEKKPININLK
ncbi:MAG: hypothetical protein A3D74_01535 [Candidatus Levybacteria bacterium RIFCSPHIGHO2_02_FULL_37_13]|nr:MAG: hypothetical protein A3D74_01535 [Candidatus Levybacteria bacterium RIFCSPHIGHO2_02_FULL_37_13]OGH29982.1 MAG: hypothetical protein A3E40_04945 [Candidatus Levybacteria bacterium RIFCSPHIGHO2_12_FULL_37_9]